jgi:hypothetical protein
MCVPKDGNWDFADFSTFCPKAIAGIGELPDTVTSRSIPIRLKRKAPGKHVERFRQRKVRPEADAIRERLTDWAAGSVPELADAEPELPDELGDRAADVWEPLLAIADLAGGEWPTRARNAARVLSTNGETEWSIGVRLLIDIRAVFRRGNETRIFSQELTSELLRFEDSPWGNWYGNPFTARTLAQRLRPYGIRPKTIRIGQQTLAGYERDDFEDAWTRYTPPVDEDGERERALEQARKQFF